MGLRGKPLAFVEYRGSLFKSADIERFELMKELPAAGVAVPLPASIRDVMQWSKDTPSFPGTLAPR